METLKRIGNPLTQALQKTIFQSPSYQPLGNDGSVPPARRLSRHNRFLVASSIANAVLFIALLGLWLRGYIGDSRGDGVCGLESDKLFGDIPWRLQRIENNQRFIDAKPPSYIVGEVAINKTHSVNPWDEIYPSTWVAFSKPSHGGVEGWGMKMSDVAADPLEWEEGSEGFGVAVMHQVHCVAVVKYALLTYEETGKSNADQVHLHHCVETLRQAIMCHADLTLEHPGSTNPHEVILSGWGNIHFCRDWDSVINAISKNAIKHKQSGWARFDEGELKMRSSGM